jgi:PLP dependent protein
MSETPSDSASRLADVRRRLASAAQDAGRAERDICLIAVSKTFMGDEIVPVIAAGQRVFGENRVQEALRKWPQLRARYPGIELHLIGPLQTNKAGDAVALFDCIQSLDRPKLAHALAQEMAHRQKRPNLFIQVNTGEEEQKAGVAPGEADALVALARDTLNLPVIGLMCIPPLDDDPEPHFRMLVEIARRNDLGKLSMGMSADYQTAIKCGATHVRVGSAIFGSRPRAG